MARLRCTGCGAQVSYADIVCPECDRPLLDPGATEEAPDPVPGLAQPDSASPGPLPRSAPPDTAPTAAPCPHCGAELPQPRPLVCFHCMRDLPPPGGPAAALARPLEANPYGTVREFSEPRLVVVFSIHPQEKPVAMVELTMGQQLLLGRDSSDQRLAALRGKRNLSRRHATIGLAPYGAWIRDETSTNGTYVDERRLTPAQVVELAEGAELRLASDVRATVQLRQPGIG